MSPSSLSIFTYQQADSRIVQNVVYNFITKKKHLYEKPAEVRRIELLNMVLETIVLPLNYTSRMLAYILIPASLYHYINTKIVVEKERIELSTTSLLN